VTLRDCGDGAYASEGVLGKPAFYALRALIRNEIAR
jgi:hypothetical protein